MEMRRAILDDLPAIIAMLADDIRGRSRDDPALPLDPAYLDAFVAIDADPRQLLVVATDGANPVGTMQLTFIPGLGHKGAWRGQIEAVRIASHLRGQGLGAEMIAWAVTTCRERGCRMVQLTSDATRLDTHRFYGKLGFQQSHLGFKLTL